MPDLDYSHLLDRHLTDFSYVLYNIYKLIVSDVCNKFFMPLTCPVNYCLIVIRLW